MQCHVNLGNWLSQDIFIRLGWCGFKRGLGARSWERSGLTGAVSCHSKMELPCPDAAYLGMHFGLLHQGWYLWVTGTCSRWNLGRTRRAFLNVLAEVQGHWSRVFLQWPQGSEVTLLGRNGLSCLCFLGQFVQHASKYTFGKSACRCCF